MPPTPVPGDQDRQASPGSPPQPSPDGTRHDQADAGPLPDRPCGRQIGGWGTQAAFISLVCLALQALPMSYLPMFEAGQAASLAHLHWGVLLAVGMLCERRVFSVAYLAVFAGWCLRVLLPGNAAPGTVLLTGAAGYAAMYAWTLLCLRLMDWPRTVARARMRQRDVIPYGVCALFLFPVGWALAHAASKMLFSPGDPHLAAEVLQVGFARFFGVLCMTLPIVLFFTGRHQPAPMPSRIPWWELCLAGAYLCLVAVLLLAVPAQRLDPINGLLEQRFMLVAVMVWIVLRLPWRWSAPLLAATMLLLVFVVAVGSQQGEQIGLARLAQLAAELAVLQLMILLTLVMSRDNRRAVERLADESRRDGLSGVPNINALRHDLALRTTAPTEIACLGIEHLDSLIAGLGLPAQEALTASLAAHLQPDVNAYTLGMGRFVLVPAGPPVSWQGVLARIEQFEFVHAGARVRIEPHLGVCKLRDASSEALDAALESAYGAMHEGSQRGETAPVFADSRRDPAARRALLQTHSLALSLLRQRRIELHVQPIRRIDADRACMAEVLCRLRRDDGQLLMPRDYMEELEASRGVVELDRAVIETVLSRIRTCAAAIPFSRLAVNLTGRSLVSEHFRNWLLYQLDNTPGAAGMLCFEITERAIGGSLEQARPLLDGLSQRGCLVALDDFGTGMQSFERLQQLPINLVKIDGTFVRNIADNPRDRELVRAMVTIARAYRAEIVAEYVEDAAILDQLRTLRVDWVQGYHIGRPTPLDALAPDCVPS